MPHPAITGDMRRWVETWKQAGPELAAIRREEIRTMDNVIAVQQLGDCFNDATHLAPLAELKEAPEIMQTLTRIRAGNYTSW